MSRGMGRWVGGWRGRGGGSGKHGYQKLCSRCHRRRPAPCPRPPSLTYSQQPLQPPQTSPDLPSTPSVFYATASPLSHALFPPSSRQSPPPPCPPLPSPALDVEADVGSRRPARRADGQQGVACAQLLLPRLSGHVSLLARLGGVGMWGGTHTCVRHASQRRREPERGVAEADKQARACAARATTPQWRLRPLPLPPSVKGLPGPGQSSRCNTTSATALAQPPIPLTLTPTRPHAQHNLVGCNYAWNPPARSVPPRPAPPAVCPRALQPVCARPPLASLTNRSSTISATSAPMSHGHAQSPLGPSNTSNSQHHTHHHTRQTRHLPTPLTQPPTARPPPAPSWPRPPPSTPARTPPPAPSWPRPPNSPCLPPAVYFATLLCTSLCNSSPPG